MVKKVLFINKLNPASIIPALLTSAGYDIHEAYDTESGLQLLEFQHYDLVFLVENPTGEIGGLCADIRRFTASPLIVICFGAGAEICVNAINAGADFFMRKAFGPMELMARINSLFQRASVRETESLVS